MFHWASSLIEKKEELKELYEGTMFASEETQIMALAN